MGNYSLNNFLLLCSERERITFIMLHWELPHSRSPFLSHCFPKQPSLIEKHFPVRFQQRGFSSSPINTDYLVTRDKAQAFGDGEAAAAQPQHITGSTPRQGHNHGTRSSQDSRKQFPAPPSDFGVTPAEGKVQRALMSTQV